MLRCMDRTNAPDEATIQTRLYPFVHSLLPLRATIRRTTVRFQYGALRLAYPRTQRVFLPI
jgi:hypothetical protein